MEDPFRNVVALTKCPFAKSARVISGPSWDPDVDFSINVHYHAHALAKFATRIEDEQLHGFVVKVGTESSHPDFEGVRTGFGRYLFALAETDVSCRQAMNRDFLDRDWQFTYSGVRFFLNVFASCYPVPHSKYCDAEGGFYVFFQPERSFDFCGRVSLDTFKFNIRMRFAESGMAYNGEQIDERVESLIYMFPVSLNDPPVKWWEA